MRKLDKFEKELEKEIERGEWKSSENFEEIRNELQKGVESILSKKKTVSVRISERDLMLLKRKSIETGIPYQTIISSLIRQYVEGKIKLEL
ncbi:hypothetical protein [Aquifex sp.]